MFKNVRISLLTSIPEGDRWYYGEEWHFRFFATIPDGPMESYVRSKAEDIKKIVPVFGLPKEVVAMKFDYVDEEGCEKIKVIFFDGTVFSTDRKRIFVTASKAIIKLPDVDDDQWIIQTESTFYDSFYVSSYNGELRASFM